MAAALVAANPGLNVVGTLCPPFRPLTPEEDAKVVAQINAAAPDIVWVGLSTPKAGILDGQPYRPDQCTGLDRRGGGV